MPNDDAFPPSPFWDWSLAVYERPGVAEALIALQDEYGLDVNLLLFCAWAAAEGRVLATADIARGEAAVAAWRAQAVEPLRAVRRALKAEIEGIEPALRLEVRRRIAAVELDAEHAAQIALGARLPAGPVTAPTSPRANLARYAESRGIAAEALDPLVSALEA